MFVIKFLMCILFFYIVPILLGIQIIKENKNECNNLILSYIMGNILQFAVFQILAIPMIFLYCKFNTLLFVWTILMLILCVICFCLNIERLKKILFLNIKELKINFKNFFVVILLIGIQMFIPFRYMYINDDDARFVGIATTAIETNTLMEYDALTGKRYETLPPLRRTLSSFPLYSAVISKLTFFPPAIVCHTIFPVIFILLGYLVYFEIGRQNLNFDNKKNAFYLTILSIISIFGNYSTRTNFTYFLIRIWQGKAILAGIVIPIIWLIFFYLKNETNVLNWWIMLAVSIFACMVSTMGILIFPMAIIILAFVFCLKEKNKMYIINSFICCLPCFIYAFMFFFYKLK